MTRTRAYWLCQLAGWGLYVAITVFEELQVGSRDARTIIEPLLAAALGIALTHTARSWIRRGAWLERGTGALALRVAGAGLALACIHVGVLAAVEMGYYGDRPPSPALVVVFAAMRWTMLFFVWLALYVGYGLVRERQRAELDRAALVAALQDAKLRALESALNPHFMFNALTTIRALVNENAERADAAIGQLARLLRYALAAGREELVTVARELESVDDYLALERLRLDSRLRIERDVSPDAARRRVPAMIVQTLVENAIKHGIARLPEGGTLKIAARTTPALAIEIENPRAASEAGSGIGLANATERLRLLCGDAASLSLELSEERATARLVIP
jgi:hypothetical protein